MTASPTASAAMPSDEDVARVLMEVDNAHIDRTRIEPVVEELHRDFARAILALFAPILAEKERVERNRDMWKGQCERQAKTLFDLRMQMLADEGQNRERG